MRKYLISFGLFFLLTLFINSSATEESANITDAKQLKGIWEAFNLYQETARQERINTLRLPLPEREEFESEEEYEARINHLNEIYKRRVEKTLKKEISNEQNFRDTVFKLELTHIPYTSSQSSMHKYLSQSRGDFYEISDHPTTYPNMQYKTQQGKVGQTHIKKTQIIDVDVNKTYEQEEKTRDLRKKIGTTGLDTDVASYNASLGHTGYPWHGILAFLKIPSMPFSHPPISEWRVEERNFTLLEKTAYLTFTLGRYDMNEARFPVIFPLSQFTDTNKEWLYYTKTLNEWEHYTETFKQSSAEQEEQWVIKFDHIPTHIPFTLEQAKKIRENDDDLVMELTFQPTSAKKFVSENKTNYILGVKLISATLKDIEEPLYTTAENIQK